MLVLLGCDGEIGGPAGPCDSTYALLAHLRVDQVDHPRPVLPGSVLAVRGESFIPGRSCVTPEVALVGSTGFGEIDAVLGVEVPSANQIVASVSPDAAARLGVGAFTGVLEVRFRAVEGARVHRASMPVAFELQSALTPSIAALSGTEVYLNDEVLVTGSGFIGGAEGVTEMVLQGTFSPDGGGAPRAVSGVRLAAALVDPTDRTRASFLWSPQLGGLAPGRFEGTVTPENAHPSGQRSTGEALGLRCDQRETFLIGVDPPEVSLGMIAGIVGRGFIGPPDGATSFRLEGEFTPHQSSTERVVLELVSSWERGDRARYTVAVTGEGGFLHAVDFGSHRGEFVGTATPVLTMGRERREGVPSRITLALGPVKQVAWVRFLPGFSESLELFGLGAVENDVRRRTIARMQEIYCPADDPSRCINVEFRTEEPEDFYAGGYAIIDIGGPDPNGLGLFGYDNTPGKDVGNIRLHDHVGGENALGALDGYGYGGVFIESMLFWSEHPPSAIGPRTPAAPPADPIFDYTFDPVRAEEVVAGEWPAGASPARVAQIEGAIHFLSSMVADTAAHEFGHSLGLAQPYGSPTDYHNAFPSEGCLMDAGRDRPLQERARLDGNPGARFCGENFHYLMDLLPAW